eukprot:8602646-Heterocapsa_arctica.AAC.1
MTAAIATVLDIGWDPISPFVWEDPSGDRWEIRGNDLSGLVAEITKTVNHMAWDRAAQHCQGFGFENGAFLCSASKVVSGFERSYNPGLASMARCVVAG